MRWWDKLRGRPPQPVLLEARDFPEGSVGVAEWNPLTSSDLLSFSGLGTFGDEPSGTVSVELNVPREDEGHVRFQVGGISSPEIPLPPGCVVQPAASLLRPTQRVRLDRFSVF